MSLPLLGKPVGDTSAIEARLDQLDSDLGNKADASGVATALALKQNALSTSSQLPQTHVENLSASLAAKQDLLSASSQLPQTHVQNLSASLAGKQDALSASSQLPQTHVENLATSLAAKQDVLSASSQLPQAHVENLATSLAALQPTLVDQGGTGVAPMIDASKISRLFAGDGIAVERFLNLGDTSDPQHLNIRISTSKAYIDCFASANSTNFGSANRIVPFNTVRNETAGAFTLESGGALLINTANMYQITFRVSTDVASGTSRSIAVSFLQVRASGASAYTTQNGTNGFTYCRDASEGENTSTVTVIRSLGAGDRIRVLASRHSGAETLRTLGNGCSLTLVSL